jgi:hypothetical protein
MVRIIFGVVLLGYTSAEVITKSNTRYRLAGLKLRYTLYIQLEYHFSLG